MDVKDILALVQAGYTKDEIAQMGSTEPSNVNADPVPADSPVPPENPEPVAPQVTEPVAVANAIPQPEQKEPTMQDLMLSIAKLTSAIQANAIAQSVIPGGMTNPPKAEDMLAEIIRPTYEERNNA